VGHIVPTVPGGFLPFFQLGDSEKLANWQIGPGGCKQSSCPNISKILPAAIILPHAGGNVLFRFSVLWMREAKGKIENLRTAILGN